MWCGGREAVPRLCVLAPRRHAGKQRTETQQRLKGAGWAANLPIPCASSLINSRPGAWTKAVATRLLFFDFQGPMHVSPQRTGSGGARAARAAEKRAAFLRAAQCAPSLSGEDGMHAGTAALNAVADNPPSPSVSASSVSSFSQGSSVAEPRAQVSRSTSRQPLLPSPSC